MTRVNINIIPIISLFFPFVFLKKESPFSVFFSFLFPCLFLELARNIAGRSPLSYSDFESIILKLQRQKWIANGPEKSIQLPNYLRK